MTDHKVAPVLLYDGLCGFCDRAVQVVLRFDRQAVFRFAPLDGKFAESVVAQHQSLHGLDSLVLVEPGEHPTVKARSGAVLGVAWHLGGAWRLLGVFRLVPSPVRDWLYDLCARHRYRIFGRLDVCATPSAEMRERFLA